MELSVVCNYSDKLLGKLAEAAVGCYIGNIFVGALAYTDDIVLLAPTARAMRLMHGICDHYALEYSILFNAKNLNVFNLAHVIALHLLRKIYQSFLLEGLITLTVGLTCVILLVIPATIDLT